MSRDQTRWGIDQELRTAVAMKAQDAYAIASQMREKLGAQDGRIARLEIDLHEAREENDALARQIRTLERDLRSEIERLRNKPFNETVRPKRAA